MNLSDELAGIITGMGRAFFFASYLPSLIFISLTQYWLLPALLPENNWFAAIPAAGPLSGDLVATLLLPLLLGILLVSQNTAVTKFFEGEYAWQKYLLRSQKAANARQQQELYGPLLALKKKYRSLLTAVEMLGDDEDEEEVAALNDQLLETAAKIQKRHEQLEAEHTVQMLPYRPHYLSSTALGNAQAVFEEYPFDRYGIDGVLFWPRLRQVIDQKLLKTLDHLKMLLDFRLNMALLAIILGAESLLAGLLARSVLWIVIAGSSFLLAWVSYRSSISLVRLVGQYINTCFDLYRDALLSQFGLERPDSFAAEYRMWLKLSAFIRRGDIFYWPGLL